MKDLDNIFTKKICFSILIISFLLFAIFEFIIFYVFILFIFIFYGICISLYFFSCILFIESKKKNIIECILFLLSSFCLILAGLTDIDYNFFGPSYRIINSVPETTSDLNFILCSLFSLILLIICVIKKRKSKKS